jgi:hypothetical protein
MENLQGSGEHYFARAAIWRSMYLPQILKWGKHKLLLI